MITAKIENGNIIITVPMQEPAVSASGKTLVIASSHGNQTTELKFNDKAVVIGVNAYIRK